MPRITKLYPLPANPPQYPDAKVLVYIDGVKCIPVRERTWAAMGLKVGDEISCDELREREKFHWKREYQAVGAWEKEKVRLEKVKALLEGIAETVDKSVVVRIEGFGADTNAFIAEHPEESGKPDIAIRYGKEETTLILVEVSGTERMRGTTYWVRPDKLAYAENHPDIDVWIVLHYAEPEEKFIFIKPVAGEKNRVVSKEIRGSIEHYVEFDDANKCVVSKEVFRDHLISRIQSVA